MRQLDIPLSNNDLESAIVETKPHRRHGDSAVLAVGGEHGGRWRIKERLKVGRPDHGHLSEFVSGHRLHLIQTRQTQPRT